MLGKIGKRKRQWVSVLITASCVAGGVIAGSWLGIFQQGEWASLDLFFRLKKEEEKDQRIVIVTISEEDIKRFNTWPIPDGIMAELLTKINAQQPRAIGLDIYRDLKVEPGYEELVKVFKASPNIIGVEKAVGEQVDSPPALQAKKQVALSDIIEDEDGKVRRSIISIATEDEGIKLGLGASLALMYLEEEEIYPEQVEPPFPISLWNKEKVIKVGEAIFIPFKANDGGYVGADSGGYQILLNFRGGEESFYLVSIWDVLEDKVAQNIMSDRIVYIGSTAESLKDFFYTPYGINPGVIIHANITSQILSAAIEGHPLLRVVPDSLEWMWIIAWSYVGAIISKKLLEANKLRGIASLGIIGLGIIGVGGSLVYISYLVFVGGWWLPVISPLVAMVGAGVAAIAYKAQDLQLIATVDDLTELANRRYFDEYFDRQWGRQGWGENYLSVILCNVDKFQEYKEKNGNLAAEQCLQKVAKVLRDSVRSQDLVARYESEEFVIILPETNPKKAFQIAQKIRHCVKDLQIARDKEKSSFVSISCGVGSTIPSKEMNTKALLATADDALYQAKENGRDRVILRFLG
ncbi:MAG: CHASE2 domain-containing protein [Gomphosphaeria aponina SAG 52.96 = DSM 107014]|uniref:CHASE2 domain-containing protein n=1 Tax=Gomphosphaeria aponina SAG 52.96 = DSM 107014 TaxID=1521640 RepID=A0A941GV00_9CHRO|nr:CHASE2 domain-containing protein [Gomphosphaeria aponina SAG 52.96 = DSM 107014]